jgi:hypothetical protein
MNILQLTPVLAASLPILCGSTVARAQAEATSKPPYIPVVGSAWHVEAADMDGSGKLELVYATYQGDVRCMKPSTCEELWPAALGGYAPHPAGHRRRTTQDGATVALRHYRRAPANPRSAHLPVSW